MSTQNLPWRKMLSANSTDTVAFTLPQLAALPTQTASSWVVIGDTNSGLATDWMVIEPYGKGAENSTFELLVYGLGPTSDTATFNPSVLGKWTCTLSADVGLGGLLAASERICDTLSLASEFSALEGVSVITVSPTNDLPARILIDRQGNPLIGIKVKLTGGQATEANALAKEM